MHFEKFKDAKGEWRWTLVASNGQKVGTSGEGYKNEADCNHGIDIVKSTTKDTPVKMRDAK